MIVLINIRPYVHFNCVPFISTNCKVPDHSILHLDFNVTTLCLTLTDPPQNGQTSNTHENNVPQRNIYEHRNVRFENTPDLFMASDSWKTAMNILINKLTTYMFFSITH